MDFKEQYKMWIEQSGGVNSAVAKSSDGYRDPEGSSPIVLEQAENGFLKPGMMYIFEYKDLDMITRINKGDSMLFYDGRPFILALEHDKQFQYGINLNVLPIQARVVLFTNLFKVYGETIQYNIGKDPKKWRDLPAVNSTSIAKLMPGLQTNIAINKYDVRIMRKIQLMKWESCVASTTLYMKRNMLFNKKKNLNIQTIWKLVFQK